MTSNLQFIYNGYLKRFSLIDVMIHFVFTFIQHLFKLHFNQSFPLNLNNDWAFLKS